jgi:uncharacterized protein YjiS (DUF1127 family)
MASHVLNSAEGLVAADRPASLKARFLAWRARRRERARIARELLSYTDRELFDLGISRADIPAILDGTYRRY